VNRFLIDHHPDAIAKQLCDQHIVKMPLEEAQMLCTSLWHHAPFYAEAWDLYKPVHQKHPCTLWAMETRANFKYAKWHGAGKHSQAIAGGIDLIPEGQLTPHPQCFSGHDDLKTDEYWPIMAYRAFYVVDKSRFARYNKGRSKPSWMEGDWV